MEYWELEMIKAKKEQEFKKKEQEFKKKEQEFKKKYSEIGKIVKYKGEYGVVVFDPEFEDDGEPFDKNKCYIGAYAVRWDTKREFDLEQYFFPYEFIDSYEFKYINMDGTLKDEFKLKLRKKKK